MNLNQVEIIIQYKNNLVVHPKTDNGKYIGIDPGINNAFTCVNNCGIAPLIINGKVIKSINQFYNKQIAKLNMIHSMNNQLVFGKKIYSYSKKQYRLTQYRNEKINQFAHKASRRIIDYALSCGANTIIIGNNRGWKTESGMGKRNNQNFIGIPHAKMIEMIKYKAHLQGIEVIITEESYTSQTSFLDNELPIKENGNKSRKEKKSSPHVRRIKRGLFKSNDGTLINSDVNGAYQIIKKVFPNFNKDGIEVVVLQPIKENIYI